MRRAPALLFGAVVAVSFAGCRSKDEIHRIVLQDQAELCVVDQQTGTSAGATIPRDKPMKLLVRSPCLGSCATDRKAKCSVKRELDKLVVSSEVSWTVPWELNNCFGPCAPVEATCDAEAVPGTTLTLVHGRSKTSFETPARLATACLSSTPALLADASAPDASTADAAAPKASASAIAVAAPPPTGAPPTPKVGDQLCALPFPTGKGNKAPIGISVARPNPCEGASCVVPPKAPKCTLKRKGGTITVKTDLPAASGKPRQPCTDDCRKMSVSCRTEPLPPGAYTIEMGETRLTVQAPLGKETCSQ